MALWVLNSSSLNVQRSEFSGHILRVPNPKSSPGSQRRPVRLVNLQGDLTHIFSQRKDATFHKMGLTSFKWSEIGAGVPLSNGRK